MTLALLFLLRGPKSWTVLIKGYPPSTFGHLVYMYFLNLDEIVLYHFLGPESQFEIFRFSNNFFMIAITLTIALCVLQSVQLKLNAPPPSGQIWPKRRGGAVQLRSKSRFWDPFWKHFPFRNRCFRDPKSQNFRACGALVAIN